MTTLTEVLFESQANAIAELSAALTRSAMVPGQISVGGATIPGVEVANAIAGLLELPIGNIAIRGWRDHKAIAEARSRTAQNPGSRQVVRLLEHSIKSRQKPTIEAEVNGMTLPLVELTLEVEFKLSTADIMVERGQVAFIRPGSATVKASLAASKVVLAKKEFRRVDLRREIEQAAASSPSRRPPPPAPPQTAPPDPPRPTALAH